MKAWIEMDQSYRTMRNQKKHGRTDLLHVFLLEDRGWLAHARSGESESEERRDRRPVVEETRRRKWRKWPLPSRGNQRPLQRPLRERPFDEGLFGEHYLPVLGAYVGAEGVDPAVRGRAIGAQGPLGRVYVEVVPTVGHLFATGTASPKGGRAERHGEHLVI